MAARPQSNAFEILSDLWLHAVKLSMLGEENKGIFRHSRFDLIFIGKLLKDACHRRGNNQEGDDTGHGTSNARGEGGRWDGVCPRRERAGGAEEGRHGCPDLKADSMRVSRTVAFIGSGWLSSKTMLPTGTTFRNFMIFYIGILARSLLFKIKKAEIKSWLNHRNSVHSYLPIYAETQESADRRGLFRGG